MLNAKLAKELSCLETMILKGSKKGKQGFTFAISWVNIVKLKTFLRVFSRV
jgi:hypothetical protein